MTPGLLKYTEAVAQRKAITRKMSGQSVNYAIVAQLEEDDIPRLLEIIRVQAKAIAEIAPLVYEEGEEPGPVHDDEGAYRAALVARIEVEKLASAGSSAKWGAHE